MLSNIHVYYQGDFLTEAEASQFMHNSLLNQVNQQRNTAASLSNSTYSNSLIKRPESAKPLISYRNGHKEDMEGTDQDEQETDAIINDLKFIRASLIDKDGNLLLKDGVNDTSSATYRRLEQLVRKRPLSAGSGLSNSIRGMQILRKNNFHELLPEAQRDLLDSNMRVDFSLFTNEKAQKELNESINFINKGINLEASNHGMTEDVLSSYKRKRPSSAHCIPIQGLLSPHSASFSNQHSKTTSRPASTRRKTITRVQDLQDRLNGFATNEAQDRCCFGDTYNSITQGHRPLTIINELPVNIDIADMSEFEKEPNQEPSHYNTVPTTIGTHTQQSDNELADSLVYSERPSSFPPASVSVQYQANDSCGNVILEQKHDSVIESSHSHTKTDCLISTTDELTVDSDGNIYAIIGKERVSSRHSTEICTNRENQTDPSLIYDTADNHGEVILDEEIFETVCSQHSQHSTQSSAIESSLNASLTKITAARNANKSRFYQKARVKSQSQEKKHNMEPSGTTTTIETPTEEYNFRQLLHNDKKLPTSFQPKTTHVAASHSTLDISEGPIEIRRIWRQPHSVGRPVSTPQIDNLSTMKEQAKSTPDICHSENIDTSVDSVNKLDRRVVVPERQGFKGSVITSYQRALTSKTKGLSEKDVKHAHVIDLKKVYGGFNVEKSSFSMESSAPLMTVKATLQYAASDKLTKQIVDQDLEKSSEAIAPAEHSVEDFQGIEPEFKGVSHSTPPQYSQIDTYPIQGSLEYSGKKEDMEDVVDLPEDSSNIQSISCLINSHLQRSDLEASLVIPRMDIARHLEHSADLLGSMIGEASMCSDESSQRGKIVLRRGSGRKEDSVRRLSSTDQVSKEPSLYERIHDFRETVKQELSQQASIPILGPKYHSSSTIPTDFEDLPPQTFINTTVIPLQKRLDEAIAAAMNKKPRLPADESDTLANYIEIDDDDDYDNKTDDRVATPTIEIADTLYVQQETPRPGDLSVIAENATYPEEQCPDHPEHIIDNAGMGECVEPFVVSRSDTQKPCVDITYIENPGYHQFRQTGIHVVDLENHVVDKSNIPLYGDAAIDTHINNHLSNLDQSLELPAKFLGTKELDHIDQLLKDAKKLNNSLQTSLYKDQSSELPVDYEAKMVLDDYELDANFPILEEGDSGIDPTGEKDVIIANYKRLAIDAAQKKNQHSDIYSNVLRKESSANKISQDEKEIDRGSSDAKASGVKWADITSGDQEYSAKFNEVKRGERVGSANWRMFAGQGSSSAGTAQAHKRSNSSINLSTTPMEIQHRKLYNKFEQFAPRQFLSSTSMSRTFKPDQDTSSLNLSAPNQSIITDTTGSKLLCVEDGSATLHNTLPIQFVTIKDQFNHMANCAKSLLMTQDLDKSGTLDQLNIVQTPERSSIDKPNAQFYTSFSGTPSRIDHLSVSTGETIPLDSVASPGSKRVRASTLGTSSARSVASSTANRSTRIKSAAISKLVKEITSVNNATITNLTKSGYNKMRLESHRENMQSRNTSKCNEKLEKAALLLEKPKQKIRKASSTAQSGIFGESANKYTMHNDSYNVLDDASNSLSAQVERKPKGSTFISAGLGSTCASSQHSKLLSSRATYEAQTIRIGGNARIKTRAIHPERPIALKTDSDIVVPLQVTPETTSQTSQAFLQRPSSSGSRPGKLMKIVDTRIGKHSQELLASSSSINVRPYYGSSTLFKPDDDMLVVVPSPATRNMVINVKSRGSGDSPGKNTRGNKATISKIDRRGRQSVTSSVITSPTASKSLLSKRPRSAIASSTRDSTIKITGGTIASDMDDSGTSLILRTADIGIEPLSLMAKPLAVQSPERILKDPYDVHGTLRDEADRLIPCRGFRVSSAGKLRLPSTIEKDLVINIRPLTAKTNTVMGM